MPTATSNAKMSPAPRKSARLPIAVILGVSVAATLFLFWLIYVHPASDAASQHYTFLPNLNALLNGLAAIALVAGYYFVRTHRIAAHRTSMFTAFIFSSLFLVSYIANHALHGDTLYPVHNATYHYAYIPILVSHIVLATLALPIVLITFFLSLSGRIALHRRVARFTFPLWLYVSITGVVVRVMLVAALR
jgi:putative membrane protein